MKSIRLSLIVYFLLLLGLGLGAVSILVYHTTYETLQAKQATTEELLLQEYRDRRKQEQQHLAIYRERLRGEYDNKCHVEEAKLDDHLRSQARALTSMAQSQLLGNRARYLSLAALGAITASENPSGFLTVPLWLAESTPGPSQSAGGRLHFRLTRWLATDLHFEEENLPHYPDGPVTQFIQVSSDWGVTWKSEAMGDEVFSMDSEKYAALPLLDEQFDELEFAGQRIRRLTLKAPVTRLRYLDGPPRGPGPLRAPAILVQCACDTSWQDARLGELHFDYESNGVKAEVESDMRLEDLRRHHEKTLRDLENAAQASLSSLRYRLLAIGLITFALTVIGGLLLVRLGLSPLQRLSDAVSRVSAKDFRLQLDEHRLPTELEPIVGRLQQTLDLLKRAFAREKQAAADISHELRTPLTALMTTIQVALRKPRSAEEYREALEDCYASAQQVNQLVERLLTLARLDAGVVVLRQQDVDAAQLAVQCANLVRPLAEARNLRLGVHCPGPANVRADPDKLREVFTNLLHNAIEYNRPEGSVELTVGRENGCLQVEVRDTGIGIAPEARTLIFERFYRADPSRNALGLHVGLGLSIVKGYVDLMGGSIDVESTVGEGSTFRLRLPAAA